MIRVLGLTKKFNEITAVNEASFEVRDGEVLGFLGPNAAGKTTTMRVITGFLAPTKGTVKVGELDVREDSLKIRKKIGYLPESVPLYDDMKVYEYLKFIAEVRGVSASKIKERIKEMIDVCGLSKVIRQQIGELSKGYRQRVGLGQAMIHDPEILVLDEPTSGLDPNQIVEIRSLIKRLGEKKTVILSTHILSEVQATCSRVVIINEGKIVASGTTEELTKQAEGKERVYVEVKGAGDSFESVVANLSGVNKVSAKGGSASGGNIVNNIASWEIETDSDIRETLFNLAVENGWKILEMRREQASLEDVFRNLTT
ncbi:ATP-binding cassette domain-containing protein [Candidatus Falkowbacteria bacterium]|nr:ATP-binding cassette domain-containing protein [Candidatus Falkowbacteria bacterium]